MRITELTVGTYRVPLAEPWFSAKYRITHHEYVVVQAQAEGGHTGTGWATTIGVGGLAVAALIESYLAPSVVGSDAHDVAGLWERLWQDLHFTGAGGASTLAIAAIDIALWDVRAKALDLPLHRLLGGGRERVKVYASAVNLHHDQDRLLADTEAQLRAGYDTFKLKIGRSDPADDLARATAVRKLIGPSRALLLDVNQRWQPGEAVARCRAFAHLDPGWIEEPLLSDDVEGHARLRASTTIPVAIGEQLANRFEFWRYVRADAVDVLQPNVWKVGGITEWMRIAQMAAHANLPVAPHDALELSVHLVAAVPGATMVENIFGGNAADLGIAAPGVTIADGHAQLPTCPGHGVAFDHAKLAGMRLTPGEVVQREVSTHAGL